MFWKSYENNQNVDSTDLVNFYREGRSGQDWTQAISEIKEVTRDQPDQTLKSIPPGSRMLFYNLLPHPLPTSRELYL